MQGKLQDIVVDNNSYDYHSNQLFPDTGNLCGVYENMKNALERNIKT